VTRSRVFVDRLHRNISLSRNASDWYLCAAHRRRPAMSHDLVNVNQSDELAAFAESVTATERSIA
jgi:hypothetical protein